jgi:C4-dicarboxylate transporter, DctM subunit
MLKEGWPFLVMLLGLLLAMTFFPQMVLWPLSLSSSL